MATNFVMSEPPVTDDIRALLVWLIDNFRDIEAVLSDHENIPFTRWAKVPPKPKQGEAYYILDNVIAGESEGLFIFTSTGFKKLQTT